MKTSIKVVLVSILSIIGLSAVADKITTPVSKKIKSAGYQELAGGNMGGSPGRGRAHG